MTGCQSDDYPCMCRDQSFTNKISLCIGRSCNGEELKRYSPSSHISQITVFYIRAYTNGVEKNIQKHPLMQKVFVALLSLAGPRPLVLQNLLISPLLFPLPQVLAPPLPPWPRLPVPLVKGPQIRQVGLGRVGLPLGHG